MGFQVECNVCNARTFKILDSYKYFWLWCKCCGTVRSRKKDVYPLDKIPNRIVKILPRAMHHTLFHDAPEAYDKYVKQSKEGVGGTEWASWNTYYAKLLRDLGIGLSDKNVLDISGGPGFFAQRLSRVCKRVVVTEFNEESVKAMHENLGVESVKFDYNRDKLHQVIDGVFDIIFILWSLNYCGNIIKLLDEIEHVISRQGVVVVKYPEPSVGMCIRWQYPEYSHIALYPSKVIERMFGLHGFEMQFQSFSRAPFLKDVVYQTMFADDGQVSGGNLKLGRMLLMLPFMQFYLCKVDRSSFAIDLNQNFCEQVFKHY